MEKVDADVRYLIWDERSRAKAAAHDVSPEVVEEVFAFQPEFFVNLPGRSAEYLMIGPDLAGRFYFVPLVPPRSDDGGWYVVTANRIDERRARRYYVGGGGP